MFQCLSGRKMHEKAFYSPFYSHGGQNGLVDLRAIAAGNNILPNPSPERGKKNTESVLGVVDFYGASAVTWSVIPQTQCH